MKAVIAEMNAYFFFSHRRRLRVWREDVLGMPLLRLELPEHLSARICRRTDYFLNRCGVHQLLNLPPDWPGAPLPTLIPTRQLWLQKAPETALFLLRRQGIDPARATVEFCGQRLSPQAEQAILALVTRVRCVSLSLPVPEEFVWRLQREYGVSPVSTPGDLALCYAPSARPRMLPLWQDRPQVEGASLFCPIPDAPQGCPTLPLLAALEEQGRLPAEEIRICSDFS